MADPRPGVSDTATVFTHGDGQAVRLPDGYRFDTDEVSIRREGDEIILRAKPRDRPSPKTHEEWAAYWAWLDSLTDEPFPEPPPQGIDEPIEPR